MAFPTPENSFLRDFLPFSGQKIEILTQNGSEIPQNGSKSTQNGSKIPENASNSTQNASKSTQILNFGQKTAQKLLLWAVYFSCVSENPFLALKSLDFIAQKTAENADFLHFFAPMSEKHWEIRENFGCFGAKTATKRCLIGPKFDFPHFLLINRAPTTRFSGVLAHFFPFFCFFLRACDPFFIFLKKKIIKLCEILRTRRSFLHHCDRHVRFS
jgi:hypothetical protein